MLYQRFRAQPLHVIRAGFTSTDDLIGSSLVVILTGLVKIWGFGCQVETWSQRVRSASYKWENLIFVKLRNTAMTLLEYK